MAASNTYFISTKLIQWNNIVSKRFFSQVGDGGEIPEDRMYYSMRINFPLNHKITRITNDSLFTYRIVFLQNPSDLLEQERNKINRLINLLVLRADPLSDGEYEHYYKSTFDRTPAHSFIGIDVPLTLAYFWLIQEMTRGDLSKRLCHFVFNYTGFNSVEELMAVLSVLQIPISLLKSTEFIRDPETNIIIYNNSK